MSGSMADYYQARAPEFEFVYDKLERQADLAELKSWLTEEARDGTVLEIACGTGYWTEAAAVAAKAIVATDINPGPLEIARSKGLGPHVVFAQADVYALPDYGYAFDVGMAHFFWSHVSIVDQQKFLAHFASRLQPSAKLLMIDNTFVAGSSTAPSRTDAFGNTYQRRRLQDGSEYEIVKNFPTHAQLRSALGPYCGAMNILQLQYYWAVSAELG